MLQKDVTLLQVPDVPGYEGLLLLLSGAIYSFVDGAAL